MKTTQHLQLQFKLLAEQTKFFMCHVSRQNLSGQTENRYIIFLGLFFIFIDTETSQVQPGLEPRRGLEGRKEETGSLVSVKNHALEKSHLKSLPGKKIHLEKKENLPTKIRTKTKYPKKKYIKKTIYQNYLPHMKLETFLKKLSMSALEHVRLSLSAESVRKVVDGKKSSYRFQDICSRK